MSENTEALLVELKEKHVQFLMADLEGDQLANQISDEVAHAYQWLDTVTINDLVDVGLVKEIIRHSVKNSPYTQGLHEMVVKGILVGINANINESTTISTLIPKDEFDDFVMHLAQYEKVRVDVVRSLLKSPIYSELISDVLYYGIKDYVMNENAVTKKVPGVSSIMKMGAKSINKAMPNLENMAEGAVKKYIESNINRTLALSEKILNNSLNEDNIKKVADHFWESVETKNFSLAADYVSEADVDQGVALAKRLWLELREAEYIHNLLDVVVDYFFAEYGSEKVAVLLTNLGFDQAYIEGELHKHLPSLLNQVSVKAFIESRVRANLDRFYDSL